MDGLTYVSSAPRIWLDSNNECKWPKNKGKERQAIIKELLPEPDWYTLTEVKVLGEYCTYKEAVYYEKKKENAYSSSSDIETEKGRRKKKFNQKYLNRDHSVTPPPYMSYESEAESGDSMPDMDSGTATHAYGNDEANITAIAVKPTAENIDPPIAENIKPFVAQFCSWTGQKQNFKLNNFICMDILKSAVRVSFPLLTDENFEKATMQWFQHGKTRYLREKHPV